MKNYQLLLKDILENGTQQVNRTGIDAISLPGAMLKFDLNDGFPAMTTKKLAMKAVIGELIGFLRGYDSAADFRALGCNIWDQNANENSQWLNSKYRKGLDDLGRIYGVQWRKWRGENGEHVDQVMNVLNTIHERPTDRRIIINAWRPDEFSQMALPPCHVLYQFIVNVERKEINLCMYQRSCDMFLGVPFNIASAALLLSIIGHLTGYKPRHFTHFLADAHIYVNHIEQVKELLSRTPSALPTLEISSRIPTFDRDNFDPTLIERINPDDIKLRNYNPQSPIKASMAV
jgi:thymidylate synthase